MVEITSENGSTVDLKKNCDAKENCQATSLKPNICRRCQVRVHFNEHDNFQNFNSANGFKERMEQLRNSKVPETFTLAIESDPNPLTSEKRSKPSTTCFLCAGVLQDNTLNSLLSICKTLLAEYEKPDAVQITLSNLDLLGVRSHLVGVGDIRWQIRSIFKWVMGDMVSEMLGVPFYQHSQAPVISLITINFEIKIDNEEFMWVCRPPLSWDVFNFSQGKFKNAQLSRALSRASHEDIKPYLKLPGKSIQYLVIIETSPAFVGGRYTKHARDVSQTPWTKQTGILVSANVEEILCVPLKQAYGADDARMHSAGREDIDVRMLGNGRPFYVQLTNVRKFPSQEVLNALQDNINRTAGKKVCCHRLTPVTRSQTELVKKAQEEKQKEYRCIIKAEEKVTDEMIDKLNQVKDLELQQNTPLRVLHRRTPLVRTKKIVKVTARLLTEEEVELCCTNDKELSESLSNRLIVAAVVSEAGTYIKEFVHGDFGRTVPSVSTIMGNRCDMLQLDVANVTMAWPPQLETVDIEPL